MASGKTHDRSIVITSPVFFALLQHYTKLPLQDLAIAGGLYLFGGLYLSPDIDMKHSNVSQRYGLLKLYWKPYQKLFPHRGRFINRNFFTHAPIIGTLIRLTYFLVPGAIALALSGNQSTDYHYYLLMLLILAVECASLVHLLLDFIYTKRG
jgi:uncharacterized metal-binding protein